MAKALDDIDYQILQSLARDSRTSLKVLAEVIGLSPPSVAERVRRLEERGVIRGFTIDIDPAALGFGLEAIARIRPMPGKLHAIAELITKTPEIVECDKVTGDDCFIAKFHVKSMADIDILMDKIAEKASTSTAMVKSHTVRRRLPPLY